MKIFLSPILAAAFTSVIVTLSVSHFVSPILANSEQSLESIMPGQCTILVNPPRVAPGPHCSVNEVMTGLSGDNILCARLLASCN
jgi:hypothetical protein